jgi:hypothetical protein
VTYRTQCNLTQKADGKLYLAPVDYDMELQPQIMTTHFGNLFNGNKLLGESFLPSDLLVYVARPQSKVPTRPTASKPYIARSCSMAHALTVLPAFSQ